MLTETPHHQPFSRDIDTALQKAARACENLGHIIEPISPDFTTDLLLEAMITIAGCHLLADIESLQAHFGEPFTEQDCERQTWQYLEYARTLSPSAYPSVKDALNSECRKIGKLFTQYDLLLSPTTTRIAPKLGELNRVEESFAQYCQTQFDFSPFTAIANHTGQPAMSVPGYQTTDKLPIGMHYIGRYGDETTLLQLARQLESLASMGQF